MLLRDGVWSAHLVGSDGAAETLTLTLTLTLALALTLTLTRTRTRTRTLTRTVTLTSTLTLTLTLTRDAGGQRDADARDGGECAGMEGGRRRRRVATDPSPGPSRNPKPHRKP